MSDTASNSAPLPIPPGPVNTTPAPAYESVADPVLPADPSAPSVAGTPARAPLPVQSTTPAVQVVPNNEMGNAGLNEYAGDLGVAVDSFVPAKLRGILYPLGYIVSIVSVVLGQQHIIDPTSSLLVAGAVQAFTNGLALSNVPKGK